MKFLLAVVCAMTASGQAVVEYSLGTAGASAASAGAKGVGTSIGAIFDSVNKTLDKSTAAIIPAPAPLPAVPAVEMKSVETKPVDPAQVSVGLDRAELVKRCGEPATLTSETKNSKIIETFTYNTTTHDVLEIKVMDGKVASVAPLSSKKRPPVAFVLN